MTAKVPASAFHKLRLRHWTRVDQPHTYQVTGDLCGWYTVSTVASPAATATTWSSSVQCTGVPDALLQRGRHPERLHRTRRASSVRAGSVPIGAFRSGGCDHTSADQNGKPRRSSKSRCLNKPDEPPVSEPREIIHGSPSPCLARGVPKVEHWA
ncbi:unnamed protein product [Durusdinium trenchii]|uniref:Uncharacterized protein n=1 Tax=Durusdinium trenchii TaxID=1381693 RepID=A0ABP0L113_9DINO